MRHGRRCRSQSRPAHRRRARAAPARSAEARCKRRERRTCESCDSPGEYHRLTALAVLTVQVLAKRVEALAKECSELVDPAGDVSQRLGVEPIQPLATVAADRDELGLL